MNGKIIDLNFIPAKFDDFAIYRREYEKEKSEKYHIKKKKLPVSLSKGDNTETKDYSINFANSFNDDEFICNENTNRFLTKDYLFFMLKRKLESIGWYEYTAYNTYNKKIEITIKKHKIGKELIVIEPYILNYPDKQIGILIDYKFKPIEKYRNTIEHHKLGLSLNKFGQSNRNFYSDKYDKLKEFIAKFNEVFELDGIKFERTLKSIESNSLSTKKYLFNPGESNSQFQGLIKYGPFKRIEKDKSIKIVFIYEEKNRYLTNQLYEALIGKSYKYTFSGFEDIFKYKIDLESLERIRIKEYSPEKLDCINAKISELKKDYDSILLVALYSNTQNETYYRLKYIACKNGIPIQGVTSELIQRTDGLKWSTSNIALGMFAKLNGIPWIMKSENKKSLIFGLGIAHKKNKNDVIEKYLAYSVCLDSSGLYKNIDVLSNENDRAKYIESFKNELKKIISDLDQNSIDNCVLHIPHKMKYGEYEAIKEVIEKYANNNVEFVVVRVNHENSFFGYAQNNCKTPYESSFIQIGYNEYLVWFEGLQYGKENVTKHIGGPLYVHFEYSNKRIDKQQQKMYLQDLINLSGANWRGFNSKKLPISIYYPQLISKFIANFNQYYDEEVSIKDLDGPWFL